MLFKGLINIKKNVKLKPRVSQGSQHITKQISPSDPQTELNIDFLKRRR